jgi:hypothetical protein
MVFDDIGGAVRADAGSGIGDAFGVVVGAVVGAVVVRA